MQSFGILASEFSVQAAFFSSLPDSGAPGTEPPSGRSDSRIPEGWTCLAPQTTPPSAGACHRGPGWTVAALSVPATDGSGQASFGEVLAAMRHIDHRSSHSGRGAGRHSSCPYDKDGIGEIL